MINRPFEGNLHHDLGITEATDETVNRYLRTSRNPRDNRALLEALNNYTSKTDSPEGRQQLVAAALEYRRLVETYSAYINEFIEAAEKEMEDYPQIVKSNGEKFIASQLDDLVTSLASKITDKFGNLLTRTGVFNITNQLLSISLRAYTAETLADLEASINEINYMSDRTFNNSSETEQTEQFKRIIADLAESTIVKAQDRLQGQLVTEEA